MSLARDLKIAARTLRTKPGFSLMVVGMLALGIGGNVAIFSIFNGMFLRPLPFAEPDRLVDLDETAPNWHLKYVGVSVADYRAWRKENTTFDGMGFFSNNSMNLSGLGQAQRVQGAAVTYDLLDVLKLKPALGRNFTPAEDQHSGPKAVMLGYNLWLRQFHGDPNVIGRVLKLDDEPHPIVGVLPREAVFPSQADLWVPLAGDVTRGGYFLNGVGRLKHGVSIERARANLLSVHRAMKNDITAPVIAPLRDRYLGDFRAVTNILLAGVGIVLLIACVNIAALMMVRGSSRSREVAIRTALGASRGEIVRYLLAESLLLAAAGAILGVLTGAAGLRGMISLMPADQLPAWLSFSMDARFAVFCVAITAAAAVLFGVVPALQTAAIDTRASLQEAGPRSSLTRGRRGVLGALVVCEIALALMLLISAGLLAGAFRKVLNVDPGFRPENVITWRISLPDAGYSKNEQKTAFVRNLLGRLREVRGVKSAGAASNPPFMGHSGWFFRAEGGRELGPNEADPVVLQVVATPGYFDAIGMTFLAGRPFDERDGQTGLEAAIVNQSFLKQYWPDVRNPQSVIGRRIRYSWEKDKWMKVVGVTRDVKHYGLDQEMRPNVFVPYPQVPWDTMAIVLRAAVDPVSLVAPAREILGQMDRDLPMFRIQTMTETIDRSLWARRAYSWLFGAFAVVALILASAGIYGVVSYAVSQRTHEIGIRMALGARPGQVLRQVVAGGMLLVSIAVALGLGATLWAARLLQSLLFGLSARDPVIYLAVILGVAAVALVANLVPARRAAAVDPVRALRFE
ncbi:MAG TPA: ABC transporter permease [Bryobacteraceae bacterium]|nr:ABC transporter permease [Bryobacteraceae bacterium]